VFTFTGTGLRLRGVTASVRSAVVGAIALLALSVAGTAPPAAQQRPSAGEAAPAWVDDVRLFPATGTGAPDWAKRRWIDKTARLLRGGEGLGPDDDLDALMGLPEEEIARRFMRDPRFGDAILDFNLYFLGFKPDRLKAHGVYTRDAFDFSNAIAAAQALLEGGDYLKLLDFEGPFYMAPLRTVPEDRLPEGEAHLSAAQLRAKAVGELRAEFTQILAFAAGPLRPNGDDFCDLVQGLAARESEIEARLNRAFDDAEIFWLERGHVFAEPFAAVKRAAREECRGQPEGEVEVRRIAGTLAAALARIDRAFAEILKHEPGSYRPRWVAEFRPFDLAAFPAGATWLAFGYEQGIALANSSTNFNRKRAAYVLKRFFCDDIVASPPEPVQQHAGAAGPATCAACHARLDPMAGFFRGYGNQFFDFSRQSVIVFDDLAALERAGYEAAWRAPPGASRAWNVGYIRSPAAEARNSYGETLADLSRILRTAPEVKRCLMRRLFEYAVAEEQMIDGGYLEHLTREFEREAAVDSAAAMKNAIVRIVTSRVYRERDPDPRRCYDLAPGAKPDDAPPCRIAHLLKKNCAGCHDSAHSGDGALDLTSWIAAPGGAARTFAHLDDLLSQRAARETFARIVERLTAADPKRRMPRGKIMRADEREELLRWARQELARASRGGAQ
jgi:mono/diheme cytochrome c family protein